jgi:hypothetical protein
MLHAVYLLLFMVLAGIGAGRASRRADAAQAGAVPILIISV